MLNRIMTEASVPITKFKRNPSAIMAESKGQPVAVLNHNEVEFYAMPAALFEQLMDQLEMAQRDSADLRSVDAQFKPSAARLREIAKGCATDLLDPEKRANQW